MNPVRRHVGTDKGALIAFVEEAAAHGYEVVLVPSEVAEALGAPTSTPIPVVCVATRLLSGGIALALPRFVSDFPVLSPGAPPTVAELADALRQLQERIARLEDQLPPGWWPQGYTYHADPNVDLVRNRNGLWSLWRCPAPNSPNSSFGPAAEAEGATPGAAVQAWKQGGER